MINIFADRPNLVIADVSKAFVDSGISALNTRLVQQIGGSFLTYDPSSDLNPITSFEKGKAYIINASQNQDLTGIVVNTLPADFVITPGINVLGGQYFAGIATTTTSFASMGLDATKISIIWLVDGDYKSFVPGEDINAILGIEVNKCYYGFALTDMDLSDYFIPPIVIPSDVEAPTDTYKYYGTEATSDKGYYNVPVRWADNETILFATAGIENIVYVAKEEGTSWYWDGAAYQQIGGGGGITTETDPTVPTIVKNIPVSADAATNKYLNWNGTAYTRKQIDYSELSGTSPLGNLFTNGGIVFTNSTNYIVQNSDGWITTGGNGVKITLPDPSLHNGRIIYVTAGNYVNPVEFFGSYLPYVYWQGNGGGLQTVGTIDEGVTCTLISNGTQWLEAARSMGVKITGANSTNPTAVNLVPNDPGEWGSSGYNGWTIKKLIAGTGISMTSTGQDVTINSSGGSSYTDEMAQDATAALFAAGTHSGITFTYDDAGNKISAAVTGSGTTPGIDDVLAVGQALTTNRTIAVASNKLVVSGAATVGNNIVEVVNSSNGNGIFGNVANGSGVFGNASSGKGVRGDATTGVGVQGSASGAGGSGGSFTSTTGVGLQGASQSGNALLLDINPTSTNTKAIVSLLRRSTTGTAANGIGIAEDYYIEDTSGILSSAGTVGYILTDATSATRTSQYEVTGVSSGVAKTLIKITGAGLLILAQGAPDYADNAAATAAGLAVGTIYKTGDFLKIVH